MRIKQNFGKVQVEAEGSTMMDMFSELGQLTEIFGDYKWTFCGHCKNDVIRYRVRRNKKKQKFFEAYCTRDTCKAVFRFGVSEDFVGELFPQKKFAGKHPKAGEFKPFNGWEKYDPKAKEEAEE